MKTKLSFCSSSSSRCAVVRRSMLLLRRLNSLPSVYSGNNVARLVGRSVGLSIWLLAVEVSTEPVRGRDCSLGGCIVRTLFDTVFTDRRRSTHSRCVWSTAALPLRCKLIIDVFASCTAATTATLDVAWREQHRRDVSPATWRR